MRSQPPMKTGLKLTFRVGINQELSPISASFATLFRVENVLLPPVLLWVWDIPARR